MMDNIGIYNAMMDFSNEKGDQELIEVFKAWLHNNMGGNWEITTQETAHKSKMARLSAIVEMSEFCVKIASDSTSHGYQMATSDMMLQLVRMFKEVKWDTTPSPKQ